MKRGRVLILVVASAALIDTAVEFRSCARDPRPQDVEQIAQRAVPLDLEKPYEREDYRFLDRAIGSASVVQLGESLHITQEFPRIRLRFIEYLHEQLGFDTLALEGSLTQSWLAQEYLYRAREPSSAKVERAQEMAWFRLWRTQPMRELMAYVYATQSTPIPLYLTSFDIQIGQSSAFGDGEDLVAALFATLHTFGPPPNADPTREAAWHDALASLQTCSETHADFMARREDILAAIDALAAWIDAIAPQVIAQRPPPHVSAVRMIPANFRNNVELCTRASEVGAAWQSTRDRLNAENALALRDRVSVAHKIMLWAHHSHVAYDSTHSSIVSMGELIHARIPGDVYTIGLFAGGGRVIDGALFGERDLPSTRRYGVERMLQAVDRDAYFLDLRSLPATDPQAGWLRQDTSRLEAIASRPTVLAKDFDGAIFIARVHPAEFTSSVVARWILRVLGFVEAHFVGVAIVLVTGLGWLISALVRTIARRVRRWRATRGGRGSRDSQTGAAR